MRLAYLDCFAGISGDMFLGALLDAGVEAEVLHRATAALGVGARLEIERVDRSGITATKVHVLEGDRLAEAVAAMTPAKERKEREEQVARHEHQHHPKTQHEHKGGHHPPPPHEHGPHSHGEETHSHEAHLHGDGATEGHAHVHGRSLRVIQKLIGESALAEPVKAFALRTFGMLGASEAKIHNVPIEEIHFHEVGAVDAIVDIVCASAGIHALAERARVEIGHGLRWVSSPVNVGGGMVECAHGTFPVPAPATADLLRGMPTYSAHLQKELVTPTGAAILRALAPEFGAQPAMRVNTIGYGAGTRNPAGFPNVLRLSMGESTAAAKPGEGGEAAALPGQSSTGVRVLETAIDDMNPQVIAYVAELARAQGALDVMTCAVTMKKGRMATLLTVLADEADAPRLERLLLRETSTLGVRSRQEQRTCLERSHTIVQTGYGEVRIKIGRLDGEELNAQPEFEDCRARAETQGVPVKLVLESAISAYAAMRRP